MLSVCKTWGLRTEQNRTEQNRAESAVRLWSQTPRVLSKLIDPFLGKGGNGSVFCLLPFRPEISVLQTDQRLVYGYTNRLWGPSVGFCNKYRNSKWPWTAHQLAHAYVGIVVNKTVGGFALNLEIKHQHVFQRLSQTDVGSTQLWNWRKEQN